MRSICSKLRQDSRFYVFEWPPCEEDMDPMSKVWKWTSETLEKRFLLKEFEATSRAKMAAMLEEDLEAIISIDFGPLMRKQIRQIPSILQKVIDLQGEIAN